MVLFISVQQSPLIRSILFIHWFKPLINTKYVMEYQNFKKFLFGLFFRQNSTEVENACKKFHVEYNYFIRELINPVRHWTICEAYLQRSQHPYRWRNLIGRLDCIFLQSSLISTFLLIPYLIRPEFIFCFYAAYVY